MPAAANRQPTPRIAVTCVVRGRVQMVGFRAFAAAAADQLGVSGWVRNRPDGAVEVLAQGAPESVQALVQRLRRGPAAARVETCEETPVGIDLHLVGFRIVG
jgi:acylphosphatase